MLRLCSIVCLCVGNKALQMSFRGNYHRAFNLLESELYSSTLKKKQWQEVKLLDILIHTTEFLCLSNTLPTECRNETCEFLPGWIRAYQQSIHFLINQRSFPIMQRGGGRAGNISRCRGRCFAVPQLAAWKSAACHKSTLNVQEAGGFWESVWQQQPA